jgi:DNA-binding transcriptional MocR family regulator
VLFPGLRVGWILADKNLIQKLSALKSTGDIASPQINQAALDSYCQAGCYELHLKKIHGEYRSRMQTALRSVSRHLSSPNIDVTRPSGGYTFWIDTPRKIDLEQEMLEDFMARGVLISKGSKFHFTRPTHAGFRVSIAHRSCEEIEEGIKRIGEALVKWI